jgi:hypothetical protein
MDGEVRETAERVEAARDCLRKSIAAIGDGPERRHEFLMEWAENELEMDRAFAEQVYALSEEEQLEPIFAFQLLRCGIGVRELTEPEADHDLEVAAQQAPPGWVEDETIELDDVALERRLRSSFRRLRAHLERGADGGVESFLAEPDVGLVKLR